MRANRPYVHRRTLVLLLVTRPAPESELRAVATLGLDRQRRHRYFHSKSLRTATPPGQFKINGGPTCEPIG